MSVILSIGAFLPGLLGKKVSDRVARILGTLALVTLMLALLGLGKCAYDASVIAKHEAAERAAKAEAIVEADRAADEATAQQALDLADTQKALEAAQAEAALLDPARAAQPVGPVTDSYYDTLRKQKGNK
jgi:uncharacterized membrane protein